MTRNPPQKMSPTPADRHEDTPKPFLDHLEDLRKTLLRMAAVFGVAFAAAVPLAPRVFLWLRRPLDRAIGNAEPHLRSLEVSGAFALAMRVSFWTALLASAPLLVTLALQFIYPGLTPRERQVTTRALLAAGVLFILGVSLGYALTLPMALRVMLALHTWMGVRAEWVISSYVVFALQLLLAFGLVFELPVVIVALGRLGLVSADLLRRYRRHAVVILLTVAAILTPPDVFTQIAMAGPLWILYEVCILLIAASERRK